MIRIVVVVVVVEVIRIVVRKLPPSAGGGGAMRAGCLRAAVGAGVVIGGKHVLNEETRLIKVKLAMIQNETTRKGYNKEGYRDTEKCKLY